MATIARVFFSGYTLMLLAVGASGVFVAHWKLTRVFWSTVGTPQTAFVVFAVLELITGLLVWANAWRPMRSAA